MRRQALALTLLAVVATRVGCRTAMPVATLPRVIVLGVDGATWRVVGPMIEAGELPAFAELVRRGATCRALGTESPTLSPRLWTTVATGRPPAVHRVLDFVETLDDGTVIPVSGRHRAVPALWEIASERGVPAGVAGWWASWPADPIHAGWVLTDHANPALSRYLSEDGHYWTASREQVAGMGRDVFPEDLAAELAGGWPDPDAFPWAELEARSSLRPDQMQRLRAAPWNHREPYSLLKTFYGVDAPLVRVFLELLVRRPVRLGMLYLRGPDPVQHYAWDLIEPQRFGVPAERMERDAGLVQAAYRIIDHALGELVAALDPDDWLLVVSDHGAEAAALPATSPPPPAWRPGEHGEWARGMLLLAGPGVRPGVTLEGADLYDVAPTVAWLLELPVSAELEGEVLTAAFDHDFLTGHPITHVPTYGTRVAPTAGPSRADDGMLQSLRALGYVE